MTPVGWYAGVGSRETPIDIWREMRELGFYLAFSQWGLRSGGAVKKYGDTSPDHDSADDAFYQGAMACPACDPATMLEIYLINARWERYRPNPSMGLIDSTQFHDTWAQAEQIMIKARGTEAGLKEVGRQLHTRNAFQVLHSSLQRPVRRTICYAQPMGNNGQFRGGTNTAIQISVQNNIPVMNLYFEEERQKVQAFLASARERFGNHLWAG